MTGAVLCSLAIYRGYTKGSLAAECPRAATGSRGPGAPGPAAWPRARAARAQAEGLPLSGPWAAGPPRAAPFGTLVVLCPPPASGPQVGPSWLARSLVL